MKENNLNNTKNVDNIDIIYKPEGRMNEPVYELVKNSKEGNFNNLKKLIEKEFQGSTLNLALRNIIFEFKQEKTNYIDCLKLLLTTNIDLNYKYQNENNSTILMMIFKKSDNFLMKLFLENLNIIKNSIYDNNNLSNKEKEEYEIKELINFFTQKDSYNNNFFFCINNYLVKKEIFNMFEYIYDIYPFKNDSKKEKSQKIQQIFKNLLVETNSDGNNFMNICLLNGLPRLVLKLISIIGYKPNINKQKNNYVHCAVLGKNFTCLKIVLYYCSIDDLNMKNCDMLTPAQLAYKLGFIIMSNLIIECHNNFIEERFKEHFYSSQDVFENSVKNLSNYLLLNFQNYNYEEVLCELNELKIINSLCKDDLNQNNNNIINMEKEEDLLFKISYIKLEWNIILTKLKIHIHDLKKDTDIKNNKNSINIYYKSILDIFENFFSNKLILSYIDYINKIKSKNNSNNNNAHELLINYNNIDKSIEILIYNKIIFYFKYGYTKSLIDTAKIYFTKIFKNNNDINTHKNSFILYVNISCILAETFIAQGYHNFAEIILSALDKYLFKNHLKNSNIEYSKEEKPIFNYLSKVEVFNQFSAYFSEIFCYSNFLKLLITKDKIKDLFTKANNLLKDSNYATESSIFIFNRLKVLSPYLEIKKLYEKDDNQIYDKISELKKNFGEIEKSEIYYYNTIGIIYLKKQKYHLSKMFFTKAFNKYMNIIKNENLQKSQRNDDMNKEKLINFRIDFITSFLYNICLCHFYLKDYSKCIIILEKLLLFKSNQNNFFIHYRLGLCYFQLYINENKKKCDYYNENIIKILGYEKFKIKSIKNEKSISIDLESSGGDQNDNASYQFDSEHKNSSVSKGTFNNKFSCHNNKDSYKKNKNNEINNSIYKNNPCSNSKIKRIILKNTTKMINSTYNNNYAKKNNINLNFIKNNIINNEIYTNNYNSNTNINYIDKAIKSFKTVILISKMNTCTDSMKSIYNFYSSYIIDDKNQKGEDYSQNFHKKKKIPNELLINNYLNLLLCLSTKKNWLEIIFIIKDYTNRKIISNKVILMKILLYKLEAYINLKNTQKVKEIINKLKGYTNKKIDLSVFNKANNDIINDVKIKFYFVYTSTIISIKEKNYKAMDQNVNDIFSLIKEGKKIPIYIPYYIIDLLINVYLIKLNNESNLNEKIKYKYNNIVLNLIKFKKTNIEK